MAASSTKSAAPRLSAAIGRVPADDKYFDLGPHGRTVTTSSRDAQTWFNRGLLWCYGFNHEESVRCFEQAILHDEECGMAYWGVAYALGPNYNKPWRFFDGEDLESTVQRTHRAVETARSKKGSPVEVALIEALHYRYPQEKPVEKCSVWNWQYADAMLKVYKQYPNDLDVAALYADALMNLTPWNLWDLRTGEPTQRGRTLEAKAVIEKAFDQGGYYHPGLLHLYIHLMEMSQTPEKAMLAADNLRGLVPDAGHLEHMPTHLDILCGDYRRAISSNSDAIRADEKFAKRAGAMNFYTLYRSHDYHFRLYAAMFAGQSRVALETVAQIEASIPEDLLRVRSPPMADWLEAFLAMRVHALIRFGRWQDIIDLELPEDRQLFCVTVAMIHYAKGIALAITGRVNEAEEERHLFRGAVRLVFGSRMLFNNKCLDILGVADSMLNGELEYRRGNIDAGLEYLRHSIVLEDALPYDEPWGWMQPTRHAYGALLLEQGRVEQAVGVYAADLGMDDTLPRALQHPNNVWALHGYHECLVKLGRMPEARIIQKQLQMALAGADVPIKSSCFCRLHADDKCKI